MRRAVIQRQVEPRQAVETSAATAGGQVPMMTATIVGAWLLVVVAQLSGRAALLHHHALIEGGPPLWVALPLFLLGWQVMIAAMMLPASLPSIGAFSVGAALLARPRWAVAGFLGPFALVWTAFGLLAFLGDVIVHHVVDGSAWLAARPWLIEAGVVGLAGAYQFAPLKQRNLAACRHPAALAQGAASHSPFRIGLDHGLACLGSSWALMLVMFAEGFANLWWMAALTVVMVYEATGRHGQPAARAVGILLLVFGVVVFVSTGAV